MFKETHQEQDSKAFELNMVIRDSKGEPVGRKVFATDSPAQLDAFYQRNRYRPKKTTKAIAGEEVAEALVEVKKHTDALRIKKGLKD